jgi:uncharacterized protein YggE
MTRCSRTIGISAVIASIVCSLATRDANAQHADQTPPPQIVVSGTAEVPVPPTKATFSIGVITFGQSAATAAEDNTRISKAVFEALGRAGMKPAELTGSRLSVGPRWEYDETGRHPKRSGFEATNTIEIAIENLSNIGALIDAALSAGATDASDIDFSAKDVEEARRRALSLAVAAARTDAETIARAGGGALGELLLLSTESVNEAPGVQLEDVVVTAQRRAGKPLNADFIPSQIKVSARVIARWKFVSTGAPK